MAYEPPNSDSTDEWLFQAQYEHAGPASFRHDLTAEQRGMSDTALAMTLPPGAGVSVKRFRPFWDVPARRNGDKVEYIVTDSSREGQKPLRVYGPTTRAQAMQWAQSTAELWRATHVFQPEWPWE